MSAMKSPEELFPNLFGKKPALKRNVRDMKPEDMRLLQYTMRAHAKRTARPALAPRRPAAAQPARPLARQAKR